LVGRQADFPAKSSPRETDSIGLFPPETLVLLEAGRGLQTLKPAEDLVGRPGRTGQEDPRWEPGRPGGQAGSWGEQWHFMRSPDWSPRRNGLEQE